MTAKRFIKKFLEVAYRPLVIKYLSGDRRYRFRNLDISVHKGVFHPGLFFSTKLLIKHLDSMDLTSKRFLELGAGTGLISMIAAQQGALVTASDVSQTAVDNTASNALQNHLDVRAVHSDLFDSLGDEKFDVIIINPPYFRGNPVSESDYAWRCGDDFRFFNVLFAQLASHVAPNGIVRMNLSEDCEIETIRDIAKANQFEMQVIVNNRALWERNYIFDISTRYASNHED